MTNENLSYRFGNLDDQNTLRKSSSSMQPMKFHTKMMEINMNPTELESNIDLTESLQIIDYRRQESKYNNVRHTMIDSVLELYPKDILSIIKSYDYTINFNLDFDIKFDIDIEYIENLPQSRLIVSGDYIVIFDVNTGKYIYKVMINTSKYHGMKILEDGRILLYYDRYVELWDSKNISYVKKFNYDDDFNNILIDAYIDNSLKIIICKHDTLLIFEDEPNDQNIEINPKRTIDIGQYIKSLIILPDHRFLIVFKTKNNFIGIKIWEYPEILHKTHIFSAKYDRVKFFNKSATEIYFSANDDYKYVVGIVNLNTMTMEKEMRFDKYVDNVVCVNDTKFICLSNNHLYIVDHNTEEIKYSFEAIKNKIIYTRLPDFTIAILSYKNIISIYNPITNEIQKYTIPDDFRNHPRQLLTLKDGRLAYNTPNTIKIFI